MCDRSVRQDRAPGHAAATLSSAHHDGQSAFELIKKKKKKDKAGHCGEYKFFSKKNKKCIDARKAKKKD
jgi:hypothetical protein